MKNKENIVYEGIVNYPSLPTEAGQLALGLIELLQPMGLTIEQWSNEVILIMHEKLEEPNWAPWLSASVESMRARSKAFPEGQLVIMKEGMPVASLSMKQVNWNGEADSLPTWDIVAGESATYEDTYSPSGNTLVLMSMNVDPTYQGKQLPAKLVQQTQLLAASLEVEHLIGSFRPGQFGQAKLDLGADLSFWEYATEMTVERLDEYGVFGTSMSKVELPKDKWLRSLTWLGMKPIKEDSTAMIVSLTVNDFETYKDSYKPESWWQSSENTWECSEVGTWTIEGDNATYQESNLWGELPMFNK